MQTFVESPETYILLKIDSQDPEVQCNLNLRFSLIHHLAWMLNSPAESRCNQRLGKYTFPKGITPKVNLIARLEWKHAYYDVAVFSPRFSLLIWRISSSFGFLNVFPETFHREYSRDPLYQWLEIIFLFSFCCNIVSSTDTKNLVWFDLVGLYNISTIVGYLMPDPLYTYVFNIYDLIWLGISTILGYLMPNPI